MSQPALAKLLSADVAGRANVFLLYVYLVSKASAPSFRLHTGDALLETGLSRQTFANARDSLCGLKLLRARETKKLGVWEYELLTTSGHPLPTFDGFVDFRKIPADDVEAFYAERLGLQMAQDRAPNAVNLLFDCPFHVAATPKKQQTMVVTIDGGEYHGHFTCNNTKCKRHGGFIHFEKLLAEQQGRDITFDEARRSVVSFFGGRRWAAANGFDNEPNPHLVELLAPSGGEVSL